MTARRLSISVPPEVEERIRAAAEAEGLPVSAWLSRVATHAATIQEGLRAMEEYEAEHGTFTPEEHRWAEHALAEDGLTSWPAEDSERMAS